MKTVQGINDFATMKEVVTRRYRRLSQEGEPLPQLVIIDGGKGQLNAAVEAIHELNLDGKMTLIGLAKNEEEIFFPGDTEAVRLDYNSESLKLIRRIRDEVHRFGITFHRQQRSKGTFYNELENIHGIGKTTAENLLKQFKSVQKIKELSKDELIKEVGNSRANLIWKYFHEAKENTSQILDLSAEASAKADLSAEASAKADLSAEARPNDLAGRTSAKADLSAEASAKADLSAEASAKADQTSSTNETA